MGGVKAPAVTPLAASIAGAQGAESWHWMARPAQVRERESTLPCDCGKG